MNWRAIILLLILLAPCRVLADTIMAQNLAANQLCRRAINAAERAHGIPLHLLAAIARVESGRRDRTSGTFDPWPWTINADGLGSFYDSKAQVMAAAASMRPGVTRSIDVGCMQISLIHHPNAFADMSQAFDPASNADYGARFLVQLHDKVNSWPRAVEMYHSATPEIGQEYGRRVYAVLPEEQKLAAEVQGNLAANPWGPAAAQHFPIANAWASSGARLSPFSMLQQSPVPHIIPQAAALGAGAPLGRSLDAYRSSPVQLAFRVR